MVENLIEALRGGLIVSCQAYPGEPLRDPETMSRMAQAAVLGGAIGIRAQGLDDIRLIHKMVAVPQIGLWKVGSDSMFITPTLRHALAVAQAGADVVAIDGTRRPRPDGLSLSQTISAIHTKTQALVMADIGDLADALHSEEAGADIVGTTLAGHTDSRTRTQGPDLELIADLHSKVGIPVLAEGRVHTPHEARACLEAGAYAVVVGTAITHPTSITRWFVTALNQHLTADGPPDASEQSGLSGSH